MDIEGQRSKEDQPSVGYPDICFAIEDFDDAFKGLVSSDLLWPHVDIPSPVLFLSYTLIEKASDEDATWRNHRCLPLLIRLASDKPVGVSALSVSLDCWILHGSAEFPTSYSHCKAIRDTAGKVALCSRHPDWLMVHTNSDGLSTALFICHSCCKGGQGSLYMAADDN